MTPLSEDPRSVPRSGTSAGAIIARVAYGDLVRYHGRSEAGADAVLTALREAGFVVVAAADVVAVDGAIDDGMCAAKTDDPRWAPWSRLRVAAGMGPAR